MKTAGLKQGCLIATLVASVGLAITYFGTSFTVGPERGLMISVAVFMLGVAVGALALLRRVRNQEQLEVQRKACKPKLDRWEREGYDVSDFKDKWFE